MVKEMFYYVRRGTLSTTAHNHHLNHYIHPSVAMQSHSCPFQLIYNKSNELNFCVFTKVNYKLIQ